MAEQPFEPDDLIGAFIDAFIEEWFDRNGLRVIDEAMAKKQNAIQWQTDQKEINTKWGDTPKQVGDCIWVSLNPFSDQAYKYVYKYDLDRHTYCWVKES